MNNNNRFPETNQERVARLAREEEIRRLENQIAQLRRELNEMKHIKSSPTLSEQQGGKRKSTKKHKRKSKNKSNKSKNKS
jgi:predicted dithiol-disulfide oxidoreductase (DUF899 family)